MHQALYRKYRPSTFDDVIGQEHITSVLSWEVEHHKTSHAYVFCGSAGTGKTSCAKILAKAVNCESPSHGNPCNCCHSCREIDSGSSVEVLEMDAASNTGVDYIRDIREDVIFTPSETGIKVYIIDEVHMLTESAFNALLKTLEEPPKNVLFVLATTEIQDIPATILSRCQRFDFKRLNTQDIVDRLNYIAKQESYSIQDEAAVLIAHLAQGGMRDAVSLFELCIDHSGNVTEESVREAAGIVGRETVIRTVECIAGGKADVLFEIVADIHRSSKDLSVFFSDLISFYRDMLVHKVMRIQNLDGLNRQILDVSENDLNAIIRVSQSFTREKIVYHIKLLEEAYIAMTKSDVKRITAEITLMRMALVKYDSSYEALESRISDLESKLISGEFTSAKQTGASDSTNSDMPFSTPKPQPVAPIKPLSTTSVSVSDNSAKERTLPEWIDIIDDFASKNPSISSFMKNSKATFCAQEKRITVWVSDGFAKMMLDNAGVTSSIIPIAKHHGISAEIVIISLIPKNITDDDLLKDLLSENN